MTRLLVECYFGIVRANLQDAVPKALMHFLVLRVQRGLQQHLIKSMYRRVAGPAAPSLCCAVVPRGPASANSASLMPISCCSQACAIWGSAVVSEGAARMLESVQHLRDVP